LKLTPELLNLDLPEVEKRIECFIQDYLAKTKTAGMVLGMSGGVDSCVAAALAAKALGGNKVIGLMLPEKETRKLEDIEHASLVAKKFKIKTEIIDITPTLTSFYNSIPIFDSANRLCKGNIKARARMIYIYYYANKLNMLVCGSSDKSETMMGYFTKWGDVAGDIYPTMDLYKCQVRKLALHIGIPKEIVEKPSTPALWPKQSAEDELGIKYEQLDLVLYGLERFMRSEEIADQLHIVKNTIEKIKSRWLLAEHKRRPLLTAKLEYRTIGTDFRLPRDPY
jgi:NAD+ synthase